MLKKINNYHIFILILIVFILNTILFKSIDLTFAQFPSPPGTPGDQSTNIVVNPLQEDLDIGTNNIIGGEAKRAEKAGLKENVGEEVLGPDPGGLLRV